MRQMLKWRIMESQRLIVFRHSFTGEDLAVFIVSEKIGYIPGQCVSIQSSPSDGKSSVLYIIDKVLDSIVLCRDPELEDF